MTSQTKHNSQLVLCDHYVLCSIGLCQPLADTQVCSRLRKSFTAAISMDFCGKADEITYSASFNSGIVLALGAAYGKTLAVKV